PAAPLGHGGPVHPRRGGRRRRASGHVGHGRHLLPPRRRRARLRQPLPDLPPPAGLGPGVGDDDEVAGRAPGSSGRAMTAIAFIGLGVMGSPMALNLRAAGYEVRAHTRTATKAEPLRAAGGTICGSVAEAVAGASIVCLCLPDTPDVEEVLRGDGGVLESAEPGALVIDFSTIRPDATRE